MTTAYITASNFSRIANKNLQDIKGDIMDVCKRVYESRDISKFLNHKEIKYLECKRLLLESTEECIQRHIQRVEEERKSRAPRSVYSPFVFVSARPPKYHYDRGCEFLSKDYLNFLIPCEIEERGNDEIQKFRDFANANKQLLLDGRTYLFIQRLKTQFNLKSDVSEVMLSNSGTQSLVLEDDLEIDISHEIDNVMNEIDNIGKTESGEIALKRFRYMDCWKRSHPQSNDEVTLLLRLKSRLADLIVKFHLQNNAMNGFSFDEGLLELVGFERCSACAKKNHEHWI